MDFQKEKFLKVKEVAKILNLAPRTIYTYIEMGKLKALKGKSFCDNSKSFIRIKLSDLKDFIKNNNKS
ncbi:MAG: helix-turn-helix domain-containing protein [Candidatus Dojkabacteria bacterium]|nr:helix-turn-helix domain-containing protein [Candidatus Dojkabacteria bacterium]